MKIISKFTDYYDYISKIYDTDYNVVYNRKNRLENIELKYSVNRNFNLEYDFRYHYFDRWRTTIFGWLCVCGKMYLIYKKVDSNGIHSQWHIVNSENPKDAFNYAKAYKWEFRKMRPIESYLGIEDKEITKLSIKLDTPIFIIRKFISDHEIMISEDIPSLLDVGFNRIMSATQIHQELDYFMGNLMKVPPDTAPPVEISNKDKIIQYGFDLKQSFRHRK